MKERYAFSLDVEEKQKAKKKRWRWGGGGRARGIRSYYVEQINAEMATVLRIQTPILIRLREKMR